MKHFYILIALTLSVLTTFAQDNRFENANKLYSEGDYTAAINAYNDILNTGVESAELYFNLANTYYKSEQLAFAILNYERASLLNPDDEDIKYNLELCYSQTTDKIKTVGDFFLTQWFQSWRNSTSSDNWAFLAILFFWICIIALGIFLFSQKVGLKKISFFIAIITIVLTIITLSFSSVQRSRLTNRKYAIVFAQSATVKSSPDNSGNELFILHEGTKVKILSEVSNWYEIQLADGNIGWLPVSAIEII